MQFTLGGLFYVVTALAIYLVTDMMTAGTRYNDEIGGPVLWALMIIGGILMVRRRRKRQGENRSSN